MFKIRQKQREDAVYKICYHIMKFHKKRVKKRKKAAEKKAAAAAAAAKKKGKYGYNRTSTKKPSPAPTPEKNRSATIPAKSTSPLLEKKKTGEFS